ncbi:cytochrome c oxidase subunit II [Xylophilus rhododendri]|uniref:Cytochrome aa3 subunit 2 n=1 Tax=Xylophilus rhododendri TaxID=2697032 RepID=A0A857J3D3_9BURK|nr:cytochrome c oxidase subunit II [Xylophilus rhododendri]QHI97378.1 cytochrome c oxidase subunit II [Xylophilus rhododendri]
MSASTTGVQTDALFIAMVLLCGGMALLLAGIIVFFAVRYRAGSSANRERPPSHANGLEAAWTLLPLLLFLGVFAWAAWVYVGQRQPPADALPVYVTGKQWMWKLQHPGGRREINELHVPLGQPVRLVMTSEDAIHSFYVPAFRVKQDVLPGRYSYLWFTATRLGDFRLFCAEYCGSEHSAMVGRVVVMQPADYARWLQAGPAEPGLAERGARLYREHGCSGCHDAGSIVRAPSLDNIFGRTVHLQDGRERRADETYLRDAMLLPAQDIVAGYAPQMPTYAGQLSEEDIQALIAFLSQPRATP